MSDREYFSLRYAVPGFSLILIVAGLNYLPIVAILKGSGVNDIFAVVLSFLSLFAGSAIGFLVSQVWFLWFNFWKLDSTRVNKHLEEVMNKTIGWILEKKSGKLSILRKKKRERASVMSATIDYLLLTEKDDRNWRFCQRKWDLYHIMSCTLVSLIFGVTIGSALRASIEWLFYGRGIGEIVSAGVSAFGGQVSGVAIDAKSDVLLVASTFASVLFLVLIIVFARRQVFNEYYEVLKIVITHRSSDKKKITKDLVKTFPVFFNEQVAPPDNPT